MHYVSQSGSFGVVFPEVNVASDQHLVNQSGQEGLYVDGLPIKIHSQDANFKTYDLPSSQNTTATEADTAGKCIKKKFNVSFLKVHKAGSTTLMNIFLRFAIEHRLNIVLPRKSSGYGFNYLGYGETVSKSKIVPLPANETYNILCNHVVYNKAAFRSIMPKDTVYVGIIREPVSHFTSAASYYGFYKHLQELTTGNVPREKVMSKYLENPSKLKIQTYFVNNRMSFDFGIPKEKFHDDKYVTDYIRELDTDYKLVLILEYFQESLVLMKRLLCWDTKDILYVPLNAMSSKPNFDLDKRDIEHLKKWNSADFKLYEHFYEVFGAKVESLGDDFKEEVNSFKNIQEHVKGFCTKAVNFVRNASVIYTVPKTKWNESFTVTMNDCRLMMESELPMMRRLIDKAWLRYNQSLTKLKVMQT